MQGPNGTGKSDRQRPGDSNTKKQAPHVRQARANKDIIPPQASGYTLASYPHAHVTCFHSHFIFQRCERQPKFNGATSSCLSRQTLLPLPKSRRQTGASTIPAVVAKALP